MNAEKSSTLIYWILFLVSATIFIGMLFFVPHWFWLALPFPLTFLAQALRAM